MARRHAAIDELRLAVECLPRATQEAMLAGVREGAIIAGAYTDGNGGTCPMLAAHRRGGRTGLLAFARAWDRFVGATKGPVRVGVRQLRVLEAQLEGAMLRADDTAGELAGAVADHQATARARRAREAAGTGWEWLHGAVPVDAALPQPTPVRGERAPA
ncbi:MAG TPA: hypothetical protein VGV40_02925 [Solirubrobacteraceae bacterium]|nr:hypothetical protein [Solirubrobacteraceae bacterium]